VYGELPPLAVTVADPVELPLQAILVDDPMIAERAVAGCVMVTVLVVVQDLASVMVTV
jgi:hypothetical protein